MNCQPMKYILKYHKVDCMAYTRWQQEKTGFESVLFSFKYKFNFQLICIKVMIYWYIVDIFLPINWYQQHINDSTRIEQTTNWFLGELHILGLKSSNNFCNLRIFQFYFNVFCCSDLPVL